jgi:hypothetical protein
MDTGPERAETVGRRRTCTRPRSPLTLRAPCKGALFLPVRVRPGELSVHPSSYRGGEEGNRIAEALGTVAHRGWVGKLAGRNVSEARAGLERKS